jgi:LEA14-like dessication related protein
MKKIIITESQLNNILLYESKEEQEKIEFKKPTFESLDKIKYNNKDGKHELLITFSVKNNSRLNLKIKDYNIDVSINGNKIGTTKMEGETIVLKKKDVTKMTVPLEIDIDSKYIIDMIVDYLKNPKKSNTINLKGSLIGGIFIFKKNIDIDMTYNFKMGDVENIKGFIKVVDLGPFNKYKKNANKIIDKVFDIFN